MNNQLIFALTFYALAAMVLASGMAVVFVRTVVHAAVALIACFFFVSWIYLILNADLLWVAQLLIYAGAIPVLIVFAIMFTRRSMSDTSSPETSYTIWGALVSAGIFGLLLAVLLPANWYRGRWPGLAGTPQVIGQ